MAMIMGTAHSFFALLEAVSKSSGERGTVPFFLEASEKLGQSPAVVKLLLVLLVTLAAAPARADLFSLAASGTISHNSSGDSTIPVGTPWTFELTYDASAPDADPEPTSGIFNNTSTPPALRFFRYRAGTYEVTLDDPAEFGSFSGIFITFTSVNAIDVNIIAPDFFPPLAGGLVSFHADFNSFSSAPIFSSDAPPTDSMLGPGSFDASTVTLLPASGTVSSFSLASLTVSLSGDFNNDGAVDAADYVSWRKNLSEDQAKLNAWRANFGASLAPGSGSVLSSAQSMSATVPEPAAVVLLILAVAGAIATRRACPRAARERFWIGY